MNLEKQIEELDDRCHTLGNQVMALQAREVKANLKIDELKAEVDKYRKLAGVNFNKYNAVFSRVKHLRDALKIAIGERDGTYVKAYIENALRTDDHLEEVALENQRSARQ